MTRYVAFPGWVRSRMDNDLHYISLQRLRALYGVYPRERVIDASAPGFRSQPGDVHLFPLASGDYPIFRIDE